MEKQKTIFTRESMEYLLAKTIIEVGDNYIKLDNGTHIYLDDDEINHINYTTETYPN